MNIKLFVYSSMILITGLTYLLLEYDFTILKILSLGIPILSLIYLLLRLSIKPVERVVFIFFNERITDYNKYIEKPRLLVYIIFIPILVFVIYYIGDINKSESYYLKLLKFIIYNSASFLCILFLQFSWTKYFVDGVKNRKSKIEYKNENEESFISYNQLISQQQKWKLYEGLLKYSFINENTSKEEFENKFLTEPIELFMDVPSFREFYNLLLNKEKELRVLKPNIFVTFFMNYKTKKIYNLKQFGKVSTPTSRVSEELQDMISNL